MKYSYVTRNRYTTTVIQNFDLNQELSKIDEIKQNFNNSDNDEAKQKYFGELLKLAERIVKLHDNVSDQYDDVISDKNDIIKSLEEDVTDLENSIEYFGSDKIGKCSIFELNQYQKFMNMIGGTYMERQKALEVIKDL